MMANYIDRIAAELAAKLPDCSTDLLRVYALLVLVEGQNVTEEDVHNAWSVWRTVTRPGHPALVPFDELTPDVQALDTPYVEAIRAVAKAHANEGAVARSLQWRDEPWNDEPVRYVGMDPIRDAYREAIDKEWEAGHFAATLAERLHAYGYEIRPRP